MTSLCCRCKEVKPVSEFQPSTARVAAHTAYCKVCNREGRKEGYRRHLAVTGRSVFEPPTLQEVANGAWVKIRKYRRNPGGFVRKRDT